MHKRLPAPELGEREIKRFSKFVEKTDGCWNWIGGKNHKGYGRILIQGGSHAAHRIAYFLEFGQWPGELLVCHSCDNPSCVNPAHLWLGTPQQNMDDMVAKGRNVPAYTYCEAPGRTAAPKPLGLYNSYELLHSAIKEISSLSGEGADIAARALRKVREPSNKPGVQGELTAGVKLTEDAVRRIRSSEAPLAVDAAEHNVSISTIGRVRRNKIWSHVQ